MASIDAYAKGAAALVSLAFALVVWSGGPRRGANVFLAAFLVLIAGNQGAETMRALAADAATRAPWFRLATVFAALDPLFLYAFAAIHPRRSALARPAALAAVGGCGAAFAFLAAGLARDHTYDFWLTTMLTIYTAVVYVVVLMRPLVAPSGRPEEALLFGGFAVAALPPVTSSAGILWFGAIGRHGLGAQFEETILFHPRVAALPSLLALAIAIAFLARTIRRRAPAPARAGFAAGLAAGVAVTLLAGSGILVAQVVAGDIVPPDSVAADVGRASAPVRWLLFGLLLSVAILRFELLGLSLRARQVAARALVGVAFVTIGALVLLLVHAALGDARVPLRPFDLALLAAVAVASQGFHRLVATTARVVYGVPEAGDRAAALDAYRSAVEQAVREGRAPEADADLARLRRELALSDGEARVMERMVASAPGAPLTAGELVAGRYRVERFVGRGGEGRVFKARDELLLRDVALKEVEAEDGLALREARLAGGLDHPNVVRVHDVVPRRGGALIVTEYLAGGSLAARLEAGPLGMEDGLRVLDGILAGLAAVHARGIVHRDLKPSNVLLAESGSPKLGDFGIARARQSETARLGDAEPSPGTPAFMAPEQRLGLPATAATDIYAVGLVARRVLPRDLPPEVEAVIARALAEEPDARWPSAEAFALALRASVATVTRGT